MFVGVQLIIFLVVFVLVILGHVRVFAFSISIEAFSFIIVSFSNLFPKVLFHMDSLTFSILNKNRPVNIK